MAASTAEQNVGPEIMMTICSPRLLRMAAVLTISLSLTFATRVSAEYHRPPRGVLEITAVGLPDLRQRTTIDVDGQAYFPVVGQVKAAGMSLLELRDKIRELLPSKVFRQRTQEGREYPV